MENKTMQRRFNCNYTVDADGYNDFATIEDLREAIREWASDKEEYMNSAELYKWTNDLFVHVFGNIANKCRNEGISLRLHPDGIKLKNETDFDAKEKLSKEIGGEDKGELDVYNTTMNIIEIYKDKHILNRFYDDLVVITNDFIMISDTGEGYLTFFYKNFSFMDNVRPAFVYGEKDTNSYYKYAVIDEGGFRTRNMKVRHNDVVLSELYNDDLPHEKVMNFIKSNEPGLIILHGEPGTGKSSYIRYLIEQFPDSKFMLLDSSVFGSITDASFIHLLLNNPNTAIILEDCESMVSEDARDMRTNNISTLLNLTDGIIGDSFNMKFICTFNTEVAKIDKALLRKGRLKLKYEFMKLKKDKIEAIAAKRGITLPKAADMTLADIMNYGDANGGENKKSNTIGFVQ